MTAMVIVLNDKPLQAATIFGHLASQNGISHRPRYLVSTTINYLLYRSVQFLLNKRSIKNKVEGLALRLRLQFN